MSLSTSIRQPSLPLSSISEEGTQAQWLFDLTRPLVSELIVCNPRENHSMKRGNKSDQKDALQLATLLRAGLLKPVYHGAPQTATLKHLAHAYDAVTEDTTRAMNRLGVFSLDSLFIEPPFAAESAKQASPRSLSAARGPAERERWPIQNERAGFGALIFFFV
jgi:hypothetical protein